MPSNYKGTFWGLEEKKYEVRLIGNSGSSDYIEIELSNNGPFVVTYNTNNTPFEPVRTSVATINVVHNEYLEDILSAKAHGTKVELAEVTNNANVIKWTGYLTPKIYDAGYEHCYETFQLDAADCVSSLQYFDYEPMNGMGIVSFKDILAQVCNRCENLEGYYWTRSKKIGTTVVLPEHLFISEHNFFSSDIQEPWKLSQVVEEICRYLGYTCLQWGNRMYFIDYQYLTDNDDIYATWCPKSSSYNAGSASHLDSAFTVTAEEYRRNGATISFEPVVNKCAVKANLYTVKEFIPSIFDDGFLKNRNGNAGEDDWGPDSDGFYASVNVDPLSSTAGYPSGGVFLGFGQDIDWETEEEGKRDNDYTYRYRIYDHKYWESVYTTLSGSPITPSASALKSTGITMDYRGGTIVDMGVVQNPYENQGQQLIVPSKMDYTRYLCICELYGRDPNIARGKTVFRLKDNFNGGVVPTSDCFLVINFSMLLEKYMIRNYINPNWTDKGIRYNLFAAGSYESNRIHSPNFRLKIGDKYWNGSTWTTTNSTFEVEAEWDHKQSILKHDDENFWNTELSVLNNVSWEDELNCDGYKIPLSGVDISQAVQFEFINPLPAVGGRNGNNYFHYEYNAYCWIKNLSIDFVKKGFEGNLENDLTYENIVDSGSVHEMSDITVRITSDSPMAQPSYSSVAYKLNSNATLQPLSAITEPSILGEALKPEQNIVEKHVYQYNTPTSKISLTLSDDIAPFRKMYSVDVDDQEQGFVQLGTEIDYHNSRQTMTCVEKKKIVL